MENYVICDSIDTMLAKLKELAITKLALASVNEKRSRQIDQSTVQVVDVRRNEIIAYKDSMIYKCVIEDMDANAIYKNLVEQGFEVKRTRRNIV